MSYNNYIYVKFRPLFTTQGLTDLSYYFMNHVSYRIVAFMFVILYIFVPYMVYTFLQLFDI